MQAKVHSARRHTGDRDSASSRNIDVRAGVETGGEGEDDGEQRAERTRQRQIWTHCRCECNVGRCNICRAPTYDMGWRFSRQARRLAACTRARRGLRSAAGELHEEVRLFREALGAGGWRLEAGEPNIAMTPPALPLLAGEQLPVSKDRTRRFG